MMKFTFFKYYGFLIFLCPISFAARCLTPLLYMFEGYFIQSVFFGWAVFGDN